MSELGKHYQPEQLEQRWYKFWEQAGFFTASVEGENEPFCIVIPPPNITGMLHMGHALNNSLQDILSRWRRMQKRNVLWLPGTDHAGIATQNVVERALAQEGVRKEELGREAFLERVWEWKGKYGDIIIEQLKRLGCSCDWSRLRFTLDEGLSRAVRTVFKRLYDEGLIYKGTYIINWCPSCKTALADDEVEHQEQQGKLWYLKYPLEQGGHISVATTRPETMLGDTAVACNPEDPRFQHLIGKIAILPFIERKMPIIADAFVRPEFGTGLVKVTPAHDPNDYLMGKRHSLEEVNILEADGRINEAGGKFRGLDRYEARRRIVLELQEMGLMEKIEDYEHSVGHCYRCGTEVEPYISLQWFVRMRPLAEPAIDAVRKGRLRFVPRQWELTYFRWLEEVRDWCISRQLWWGHRIPAWYCLKCGGIEVVAEGEPERCSGCQSDELKQDDDVLDTWFSSALWPFSTLGWPEETAELRTFYPTSVLVTGHDIIFFWVARMVMMGLKFMGDVPFHEVYINPIIFDEQGEKMSKSKGNAIDPVEVIEQYGTDSLRITLCAYCVKGRNILLSEKRFEGYRNFMNKLWNASRLILSNVEDLTPGVVAAGFRREELGLAERWIISRLLSTAESVNESLERYEFDQLVHRLYHFLWHEFCDWYLELAKPALYSVQKPDYDKGKQRQREVVQTILVWVLEHFLRMFHPVIPFTTEELWQKLKQQFETEGVEGKFPLTAGMMEGLRAPSIMVAPWVERFGAEWIDEEGEKEMELVQQLIYAIRNIRGELGIVPSMRVRVQIGCANAERLERVREYEGYFHTLINIEELEFSPVINEKGFSATGVVEDFTVVVPMPEELREKERQRLNKEIAKLERFQGSLTAKLDNQKFLSKAPAEVIAREREKLSKTAKELEQLQETLRRLQGSE